MFSSSHWKLLATTFHKRVIHRLDTSYPTHCFGRHKVDVAHFISLTPGKPAPKCNSTQCKRCSNACCQENLPFWLHQIICHPLRDRQARGKGDCCVVSPNRVREVGLVPFQQQFWGGSFQQSCACLISPLYSGIQIQRLHNQLCMTFVCLISNNQGAIHWSTSRQQ